MDEDSPVWQPSSGDVQQPRPRKVGALVKQAAPSPGFLTPAHPPEKGPEPFSLSLSEYRLGVITQNPAQVPSSLASGEPPAGVPTASTMDTEDQALLPN